MEPVVCIWGPKNIMYSRPSGLKPPVSLKNVVRRRAADPMELLWALKSGTALRYVSGFIGATSCWRKDPRAAIKFTLATAKINIISSSGA